MIQRKTVATSADASKDWQKTQYSNLIRYVPSGTFFARLRVNGNLIRKSLKTDVLSVAKLRLADFEKNERESAETRSSAGNGPFYVGANKIENNLQMGQLSPTAHIPSSLVYSVKPEYVTKWPLYGP